MERILETNISVTNHLTSVSILKGMNCGLIGGLTGTIVMDLFLMGAFTIAGLPALTCFLVIGNTFAGFFSIENIEMARAIQIGVLTHYVIGPLIGALFGMAVVRIKSLRVETMKKSILLAILYVELISQPLLATTPILLNMRGPVLLVWYGGSFLMHLIAAVVLGTVVYRGLCLGSVTRPRGFHKAKI